MGKIITFANQKGGSGKTTLSVNLAVLWSNSQYRVAIIDADSQNSLKYWLEARKKYYGEDNIGIDVYPFESSTIIESVKKITNKINQLKSTYAWKWGNTPDQEREVVKGMILQSLGLAVSVDDIIKEKENGK